MNEMLPCPRCSVPPIAIFRPTWFLSRRLSEEKGQQHWLMHGCSHAKSIAPRNAIDEAECAAVEQMWDQECERMFDELTARWNSDEREAFRQKLKTTDKFKL